MSYFPATLLAVPYRDRPADVPGTWDEKVLFSQMRAGQRWGIFLDDTGNAEAERFHPRRTAWVAVLAPPERQSELWSNLMGFLDGLKGAIGAEEFHFSPLFAGKDQYQQLTLPQRLYILEAFADMFKEYELSIFVAQTNPDELRPYFENDDTCNQFDKSPLNPKKPKDITLVGAILSCHRYIRQDLGDTRPITVYCDTREKRENVDLYSRAFIKMLDPPAIRHANSKRILPLQLADFAAWSLSRLEQLIGRWPHTKWLDQQTYRTLNKLRPCFVNFLFPSG